MTPSTQVAAAAMPWRSFELRVTQGPEKGKRLVMTREQPQRQLIGTSEACDLRLSDPEVSRRHVSVELVRGAVRLIDLGSTNGTRVDRVRVLEALLTGGEVLRLGQTTLQLDEAEVGVKAPPEKTGFGHVLGASEVMRRLYPLCERLARADVPVLIEGETGTGKEVFAQSLHDASARARGPFVVFDCSAATPSLLEAELFGHERGAFTGALTSRPGVFEQADGGTLFIDELGELALELQPRLLRAVERQEVRRLGATQWQRVDVRVIAATRRNLDLEVQEGRFRDDLFHRVAVTRLELPPLRERTGDVELLARALWQRAAGSVAEFPEHALEVWRAAPWPGNVRELRNAVERVHALGTVDAPPALPPELADDDGVEALLARRLPFGVARDLALAAFERRYVAKVLAEHGGDVGAAATASGIGRRYFQKLKSRTS